MKAVLVRKERLTPTVSTFWFKPDSDLDYNPGQFVEVSLPHSNPDERGVNRWFTLSSSPTEELLAITTKLADAPSSFMHALFDMKPGSIVQMSEAMGDFVLPQDKSIPIIFVIGGIGVTPVRSMLRWIQDTHEQRDITVLYAASSNSEIAFRDVIEASAASCEYFISGEKRLQTEDIVRTFRAKSQRPFVYLSGPEELVEILFAELSESGIPNQILVTDYFPGYGTI